MANENTTSTDATVTEVQQATKQQENTTPTVEELMAQLATAKADAEKYKTANDKLSKSEAEMKRQLRAKQTAEEQEAEAQAEAKRLAEEERETLRKENNRFKAMAAYKSIDEKTVDKLLEAVSDADHNAIANIIADERKKAVAEAEAKWLKDRPTVKSGQYSGMTKEQILAISDDAERIRAIASNKDLF